MESLKRHREIQDRANVLKKARDVASLTYF
jgi:hypothetical protein